MNINNYGKFNCRQLLLHYKQQPKQTQVNILTCLETWIREEPAIGKLYGLFCDLVHPNLGSTLMVTRIYDQKIVVGGSSGTSFGIEIFNYTFADLFSVLKTAVPLLLNLRSLKF
jgi:hypothetical protein